MPFFEKVIHLKNRSKSDNLFKSEKVTNKFWDDHKNKPLTSNEKLVNSKMNKIDPNKSVLQHEMRDIGKSIGDIFEQLHLSIPQNSNLFFYKNKLNVKFITIAHP